LKPATLIIAAAQFASIPGDISQNLSRHLRFAAAAAEHGVQLLVFPELSLTGYEPAIARSNSVHPQDSRLDPLRHLAEKADMTIVVGAPILNEQRELHIGALALCPDGSVSTYTKQYLHQGEEEIFAPGQGGAMLLVEDTPVALAICADTTRPQHAADAKEHGASIYAAGVLITEGGYEPDTTLLSGYSAQHKMVVLMANHSAPTGGWVSAGKSAIWSEDGDVVIASPGTTEALVIARKKGHVWDGVLLPTPASSATFSS
jgi:predicted amidohydrolase